VNSRHIYDQIDYPLRTHQHFLEMAALDYVENGIFGETALTQVIELPDGALIDYLHLLCLGLFRALCDHWFNPVKNKYEPFYIGIK
jgi:hypothetical protein